MSKDMIRPISENYSNELELKKLYNPNISPSLKRLREVKVQFYDFAHILKEGKIICFDVVAEEIVKIFDYLLEKKFPLSEVKVTSDYDGDDEKSMEANNTSCFNSRMIENTERKSIHATGMALDINPVQNPFVKNMEIKPPKGEEYLDRSKKFDGKAEDIVDFMKITIFEEWGGDWKNFKDYHHFQVKPDLVEILLKSSYEEGQKLVKNRINDLKFGK